jgi:heat shock transcription factor
VSLVYLHFLQLRKNILTFITSFLEESRNTELIRWSDDGRSFIVLDEDEFAKTLIPELFKHNNYASFVRQLNMYGFHKKVGLADNSMKASENKRKTPSEYANPYFRRGKPDLLWLIQKPKSTPGHKAPDAKVEEEEQPVKKRGGALTQVRKASSQNSSKDLVAVSQGDLENMRQEIYGLKQQNRVISEVITNMKKQNVAIHQQAIQFQQAQERFQMMHERHENSINAILTFLATFYNRSLEGQGGQNIANMFAQTMAQGNQSGSIVDMTDLPDMNLNMHNMQNRTNTPRQRRAQLLLPAPSTATSTPSSRIQKIDTPPSQAIDSTSPNIPLDTPDILSLINAANTNSPQGAGSNTLDFDSALEHMQNADGNTPLTDAQRSDVLQRMTHDANTTLGADASSNIQPISTTALTPTASSPLMNLPSPDLEKILNQQTSLDYVQKLQEEQAKRVQHLAEKLGPLSPNGLVPGLHDTSSPVPENWNLDDWLNNGEYFPADATGTFDPNLPDPLLDGDLFTQDQPTENKDGATYSQGGSPVTVEDAEDADLVNGDSNPRKRRRQD